MLDIIYQDESIVVCVKPFRVLSTDEPGGMPDRIREAIGQPQAKVRTVHRLDQVVGGLMVYGLTGPAASELSRQIREDTFLKEYQAVVHWRPQYDEGTFIDLLGRSEKTRKTYVAKYPGKGIQQAVLHYKLLDNKNGFSLVEIRLETGRPEVQQVPRPQRVADRPLVQPPGLCPPGHRRGDGFPAGPTGDRALDLVPKQRVISCANGAKRHARLSRLCVSFVVCAVRTLRPAPRHLPPSGAGGRGRPAFRRLR